MVGLLTALTIFFVVFLHSDSSMASVDAACRNAFCSPDTDPVGIGTTESTLVSRYGEGLVTETRTTSTMLNRTHCYFLPQNNMWVEFVINYHHSRKDTDGKLEEIFASKELLCDKKYVPENSSGRLSTAKGISIGDPVGLIHQRLGEPSLRINTVERETQTPSLKGSRLGSRFGTAVLRYLPSNATEPATEFFLKDDAVYSLWIGSTNE